MQRRQARGEVARWRGCCRPRAVENDGWAREGPGSHGNVPETPGQCSRSSGGRHRGKDAAVDEKRQVVGGET